MSNELTRRRFLETTSRIAAAATVAGLAADSGRAADKKPPAHGLHKALKYSMIAGKASIVDKFKLAKSAGFEGVDINVRLNHDEVNRAQDVTQLKVHGVVAYDHWRKPLSHPDPAVRQASLESLQGAIRDAKAYGGTTVLLVPAVVSKQITYADAYKRSQAEIRKALPLAEELGIRVLLENVWNNFLLSPVEMARYIDEFDSQQVGAYFDVGNVVRFGWPEHWIQTLGNRIGKLDIKEYSRTLQNSKGPWAGFGVKLGEGDCDWPAVMQALADIGYKGWATAEVRGGRAERLIDISQRMDRIFSGST